jgi:hypothetical protein
MVNMVITKKEPVLVDLHYYSHVVSIFINFGIMLIKQYWRYNAFYFIQTVKYQDERKH